MIRHILNKCIIMTYDPCKLRFYISIGFYLCFLIYSCTFSIYKPYGDNLYYYDVNSLYTSVIPFLGLIY